MQKKSLYFSRSYFFRDSIFLIMLIGIFYTVYSGSHPLFTPDEGRYSEVAREMAVTGDYITPHLNGVIFLDKPIMHYWLHAIAIKLFGLTEWAVRFWPAVLGVIGCIVTYIAGSTLFNRRTGFLAAVILATSPLYYGASHYANLDLEVGVFIASSLLFFLVYSKQLDFWQGATERGTGVYTSVHEDVERGCNTAKNSIAKSMSINKQNRLFLWLAYFSAGLAVLTKGLIGILFPMVIIGSWILLLNRWDMLKKMRLGSGLLIFAITILPWYLLVQKANPIFFEFFIVKEQFFRYLSKQNFNNHASRWFYIPLIIAGTFPWCIFLIQSLTQAVKRVWQNRSRHMNELFLLIWFVFIFVFFSIPQSKLIGYIVPVFPSLSLLIAHYLDERWDNIKNHAIHLSMIVFSLICLGIIITCITLLYLKTSETVYQLMTPYLIYAIILFIGSIITTCLFIKKQLPRFFILLLTTSCLFLLIIAASSHVINQKTIKPLALQIKPLLKPEDEIVSFYSYFQDLPFYLERRITVVADWDSLTIPLKDNWLRELWNSMSYQNTREWLITEDQFWQRWHSKKKLYVFTDIHHYSVLEKKLKTAKYKISQYNNIVILTNHC